MRCLIVHNPRSGFGSDAVYAFERELVRPGDECVLRVLDDENADEKALDDAETFDVVVISGGDGTISNLLYMLRDRAVPTCVFPSGTANLLFANIGNSPEPAALARACRWGDTISADLGEASWESAGGPTKRGFSIMTGTGFDAELMAAAAPNKRTMGEVAYFMAALSDPTPKVNHFAITVDGEAYERDGIACLVANNAMLQLDVDVVPGCVMDDGLLDVIVLEVSVTAQLIRPLIASLVDPKGERGNRPRIETFRGRRIEVKTSEPIPMQVDGEVVPDMVTSWRAEALPAACELVVDGLSRYQPRIRRTSPKFPVAAQLAFPE